MSDWHARLQRPQHLASALGEAGHICYFLNLHLGRQFPTLYPLDRKPRLARIAPSVLEVHARLPAEPVYHHRMLTTSETALLADTLGQLAAVTGHSIIQLVAFPTWGPTALELRRRHGWPIVYDCHDFLPGFPAVAQDIVEAELPLIQQADHVIFSSLWLQEYVSSRMNMAGKCTSIVRNAVQRRFLDACDGAREHRTFKTVGDFGALDSWFDIEAVRLAAQRHPDVRFQLIGRVEHAPVLALKSLPNVEFKGEIAYENLPAALMQFDVGLIPFEVNDLTRAANPIKLYEYFSAGIPVVSTRLPEVELFSELVYVADTADQFATLVGTALAEISPDRQARRIAAARSETWESRAEHLLQIANGLSIARRIARL